jgi:CheY-like chemotaxis protein
VEALKKMEQTRPDLIIADIMMPALDGYGLYEHIRRRPEWSSIPIIFLTSKAEPKDVMKGEALGIDGYITKPFDPEKLLDMVHTLLSSEKG